MDHRLVKRLKLRCWITAGEFLENIGNQSGKLNFYGSNRLENGRWNLLPSWKTPAEIVPVKKRKYHKFGEE